MAQAPSHVGIYDAARDAWRTTSLAYSGARQFAVDGSTFLDGEAIRCSRPDGTASALVATGFPFRELSRLDAYLVAFSDVVRSTAGLRRAGSAAIDLAYTACGRYDGFFELGLSRWDLAAGALLVREAGGTVTDVLGGDGYLESGDIVAAGTPMHEMLVGITRSAFG